jgi:anaerobic magnesium-protoporphyrin IX monomethyl ester cyclase
MVDVLFTHSFFYRFDPKQWKTAQPYPPLATIQAASVVRDAGFSVALFDTALREDTRELIPAISQSSPRYLVIYDDGFNYLTKMCLTKMRDAAMRMAFIAKQSGICVIINSSDSTDHAEEYLAAGADYVIRGEGESTLVELLHTLSRDETVSTVSGITYRRAGDLIKNATRAVMRELDKLPLPAWDLVDLEPYRKIWKKNHGYFSLNIATTRGCPFKCNWCAKPIYGNRYNSRSPEHVADELALLIGKYDVEHFWMCDDIFGLKPGWIANFRDEIRKRNLRFRYKIQSRVDLLLEEDTIEALAQSGAETVWVGAESGSQKILDAMDKGTTVEQIAGATKRLQAHDIRVAFFLQFGYPGETREDIDKTVRMVRELMPDEIGISISYPLPGTVFYEKVRDQLTAKQNWSDSNDLALMFRGTFSADFYRALHGYVHSKYRIQRGKKAISNFLHQPASLRIIASMCYHLPLSWLRAFRLQQLQHVNSGS